jgi:hypothetical protein
VGVVLLSSQSWAQLTCAVSTDNPIVIRQTYSETVFGAQEVGKRRLSQLHNVTCQEVRRPAAAHICTWNVNANDPIPASVRLPRVESSIPFFDAPVLRVGESYLLDSSRLVERSIEETNRGTFLRIVSNHEVNGRMILQIETVYPMSCGSPLMDASRSMQGRQGTSH